MALEKAKILRSVSSMGMLSISSGLLSIVQLSVLARYLDPKEFGLFALINIPVSTFNAFLAGLPLGVIQRKEVSDKELGAVHHSVMLAAFSMSGACILIAYFISIANSNASIVPLATLLSLMLMITSLGLTHQVWLRRELKMEVFANASILGSVVGVVAAIWMAMKGFGVLALIYSALIRSTIIALYVRWCSGLSLNHFRPLNCVRPFAGFGVSRGVDQSIGQFSNRIDQMMVGLTFGTSALGLYTVASNVSRKPSDLINPVVGGVLFPLFAKTQDCAKNTELFYEASLKLLALIALSVAFGCSVFSYEVVVLLLGDQWLEAVPYLKIIPFVFAFLLMESPHKQIANARGASNHLLIWNIVSALLIGLVVLVVYVIGFGMIAVAWALLFARFTLYLIAPVFLVRKRFELWWEVVVSVLFRVLTPFVCIFTLALMVDFETLYYKVFFVFAALVFVGAINYGFIRAFTAKLVNLR